MADSPTPATQCDHVISSESTQGSNNTPKTPEIRSDELPLPSSESSNTYPLTVSNPPHSGIKPGLDRTSETIQCEMSNPDNSAKHDINILYYNARSLFPKIDELRLECANRRPDIVCIVESWIDNSVTNGELLLSGYQLYRRDRNRHGGGILIYVNISFSCELVLESSSYDIELLSLSIFSHLFHGKLCVCCYYRPPSHSVSVIDDLYFVLQSLDPARFSFFLLIGDFNVDFYNQSNFLFSHISDIMNCLSLTQVVPSYTHLSPDGKKTLIDLAMVSDKNCLRYCTTVSPLSTSDHLGVSLAIQWKTMSCRQNVSKPRRVWLYDSADFANACKMLQDVDWNAVFTSDVDESAENWTNTFLSIMEKCIPTATLKKRRLLPWLNNNIRKHMRKRNIMFRKAKRTNNINHMRKFRQLRNKVVTMLRQERMKYFNALSGASNKTFWKAMKCLHQCNSSFTRRQHHSSE